jgi:hypothetical protein
VKAATHVSKLRESWQHLLRDRATRSLTYNDEQFHILERIKMQEKSKCLTELLNEECQLVIVRLTEVLSDWYKTAQAAFIQTEILVKDMSQFEDNLHHYLLQLSNTVDSYQSDLETLTLGLKQLQHAAQAEKQGLARERDRELHSNQTSLDTGYQPGTIQDRDKKESKKNSINNSQRTTGRREYVRSFNRGLKELNNVQEEVWNILKENAELVNQFQTLTLSILTPDPGPPYEEVGEGDDSEKNSLSSDKSDG